MPANVFVSFDHDDQHQVAGFKALLENPNHPLDFHDHSLEQPVVGRRGKSLIYPPDDLRAKPVRKEIIKKFNGATRMLVLIGKSTHSSAWVKWEILTFFEKKKLLSGTASERIIAMRLKGFENVTIPRILKGRSSQVISWNPGALNRWLDKNLADI
ncbi:TIR domain-containing protein [Chloroflexota bacterium]